MSFRFVKLKAPQSLLLLSLGLVPQSTYAAAQMAALPSIGPARLETIDLKGQLKLNFEPWQLSPTITNFDLKNPEIKNPLRGELDPTGNDDLDKILAKIKGMTQRQPFIPPKLPFELPGFKPVLKWKWPLPEPVPVGPEAEVPDLTPRVTGSIDVDGRIAVFKTSDPHLYFVVPNRWSISLNGVTVEALSNEPAEARIRFLLTPSYEWTGEITKKILADDPLAFFVPLPKKFRKISLEIPDLLGEVKNQLLPTDSMTIGEQIYMSVEVSEESVDLFRLLAQSQSHITGLVQFAYPLSKNEEIPLNADIWINFSEEQLGQNAQRK